MAHLLTMRPENIRDLPRRLGNRDYAVRFLQGITKWMMKGWIPNDREFHARLTETAVVLDNAGMFSVVTPEDFLMFTPPGRVDTHALKYFLDGINSPWKLKYLEIRAQTGRNKATYVCGTFQEEVKVPIKGDFDADEEITLRLIGTWYYPRVTGKMSHLNLKVYWWAVMEDGKSISIESVNSQVRVPMASFRDKVIDSGHRSMDRRNHKLAVPFPEDLKSMQRTTGE